MKGFIHTPRGHRVRLALGFLTLLVLVTGLFFRADEVSPLSLIHI